MPCEGSSRPASQPELHWPTNWLTFSWRSRSPCRVDDVHDRSMCDSLSPCSVAAHSHSLLYLNTDSAAACHHCSLSHLRVRHCIHLVGFQITTRTSCFHVLTTSPGLPDSDRPKNEFVLCHSFIVFTCLEFSTASRRRAVDHL